MEANELRKQMRIAQVNAAHAQWALNLKHFQNWESMAAKNEYYEDMLFRAGLVLCGCTFVDASDLTHKT